MPALAAAAVFGPVAHAAPGETELISATMSTDEAAGLDEEYGYQAISADGRFVAFVASNPTLPRGADGVFHDVFFRDRETGVTERVSVAMNGAATDGENMRPSVSADGRFVVFASEASNLVPNDTNGSVDVFLRDRQTGTTTRLSVGPGGVQANGRSDYASISDDGRFVAFSSTATNLLSGGGTCYMLVRNLGTGAMECVARGLNGSPANGGSGRGAISASGRFVAFESTASNLVPGDTNGKSDIFVYDRQTGTTDRVSTATNGTQGNAPSYEPRVSSDGRVVVWWSWATNLVAGDTNNHEEVFAHDRQTGITERVGVNSNGQQAPYGSGHPSISGDGRYVAFQTYAALVPGDRNNDVDVYVRDLALGITERVSVAPGGGEGNGDSSGPAISTNGRFVHYRSVASNLVSNDYNTLPDTYVTELGTVSAPPSASYFTLKPASLDFGGVTVGSSLRKSFWLQNRGDDAIGVASIGLRGTDRAQFGLWHTCGDSVAVGDGCRIVVTFRPTSTGDKSAKVRVETADGVIRTRTITGIGVAGSP